MAFKKKYRITKTKDEDKEEILVEDMEEKEEVIDMEGEAMDAAEYKEVTDMCKDLGFENIKDALTELKELKGAKDKDPDETEEEKKKREAKEAKDKKNPKDAAIPSMSSLEQDIATIDVLIAI